MLGIIAAKGVLPIMVASGNAASGGKTFVACISGLASKNDYQEHIAEEFPIGKAGAILKFFKSHKVEKIVICGAMERPNFSGISVDTKGALLLTKILAAKFSGDDQILRIVAEYIEKNGFKVVSPIEYLVQKNIKTKRKPQKSEIKDIQIGLNAAKILGELDIGQSVVVDSGVVIGVEAREGTDGLIKRCAKMGNASILVKSLKPTQDPRLDTPVIGTDTVKTVAEAGFIGIALSDVIIIDPDKVSDEADKLGIFLHICA